MVAVLVRRVDASASHRRRWQGRTTKEAPTGGAAFEEEDAASGVDGRRGAMRTYEAGHLCRLSVRALGVAGDAADRRARGAHLAELHLQTAQLLHGAPVERAVGDQVHE